MMSDKSHASSKDSQPAGPIGDADIETLLRERISEFSPSEKSISSYLLNNIHLLPFETGSSIAQGAGVSEMTVSRFIRGLGFKNMRELRKRLRNQAGDIDSDVDDYLARFQTRDGHPDILQESLRLELDAIVKAYTLATSDLWQEAVAMIAKTRTIYVVGFQAAAGLALDFSTRLLWARPNVIFVENRSGTFGEILNGNPRQSLVVFVDTATYSANGVTLAERLVEVGMPVIIVTDKYTHWAFNYTPYVFEGHTHVKTFWDSTASLSVILNLLIDGVANKLGANAQRNFDAMKEKSKHFKEFVAHNFVARKD